MLLRRAWVEELKRLGWTVTAFGVIGALLGYPLAFAALALFVHLIRIGFDLRAILLWAQGEADDLPPDTRGFSAQIASAWLAERRRARNETEAHRHRAQRVQSAIHALPDAIVDLDKELNITWCNGAGSELLGIRTEDDRGHPISNLVRHPDFIAFIEGEHYVAPVLIPSPNDPQRYLSVRLVRYGSHQAVLLARDETDAIRLDRVRQDFVANVSHELKTPLAVLSGYAETLSDTDENLPERWQRPIGVMNQQITRMTRLVDDLLLLSRTESTARPVIEEAVDVAALVRQTTEEVRVMSAGRHEIECDIRTDAKLRGDDSELRTAFSNLVANAVQHTPPGGEISVHWYRGEDALYFEVRDTGEGIEEGHLPRLTERFYRVDTGRSRDVGGTGLGLAIVKHVLQHYRAVLEIESEIGVGSCFRCRFPLPADTQLAPPESRLKAG